MSCKLHNILSITDRIPTNFVAVYHANGTLYLSWNQQSPAAIVFCSFGQENYSTVVFLNKVNAASCGATEATALIVPYNSSVNLSCSVSAKYKHGISQSSTVRVINGSCKSKSDITFLILRQFSLFPCSPSLSGGSRACPILKYILSGLLATATGAIWADHSLQCVMELFFHWHVY